MRMLTGMHITAVWMTLEGGTECVDESVYGTEFTDDTASDDLNDMFGSTSNDTEVE